MKGRGLYGQLEGTETNPTAALEFQLDSEVIEGKELSVARRLAKERNFKALGDYIESLRVLGWKQARTDSLLTRAMQKVRLR